MSKLHRVELVGGKHDGTVIEIPELREKLMIPLDRTDGELLKKGGFTSAPSDHMRLVTYLHDGSTPDLHIRYTVDWLQRNWSA